MGLNDKKSQKKLAYRIQNKGQIRKFSLLYTK